ncbi:MAG TPA: DUF4349 domain-containing protein [Thermoanaerobaculia bacterium]|nr:DUF4349 domain-containing protein [Thermoanaerobaculia bacterium]
MSRKSAAVLALVLLVACKEREGVAGLASGVADKGVTDVAQASRAVEGEALGLAAGAPAALAEPAAKRMIVRSAELRVIVSDTSKAVAEATRAAEAVGGYVAGSHIWREGELLRARLTLRVPSDKLSPALAQLRALAKRVENETVSSEDVSEEFVDLEARVRNLEATEEELRQLLVVARQNSRKASDVLEVHTQLTQIRGQIEQVRGRMRYLSQVAAMSAIALDLTPDALAQPVVEPGWQPLVVAKDALRTLLHAGQLLANAAIWGLILGLPVGLLAFAVWKGVRRTRTATT